MDFDSSTISLRFGCGWAVAVAVFATNTWLSFGGGYRIAQSRQRGYAYLIFPPPRFLGVMSARDSK